jgi:hypothetical protein
MAGQTARPDACVDGWNPHLATGRMPADGQSRSGRGEGRMRATRVAPSRVNRIAKHQGPPPGSPSRVSNVCAWLWFLEGVQ